MQTVTAKLKGGLESLPPIQSGAQGAPVVEQTLLLGRNPLLNHHVNSMGQT